MSVEFYFILNILLISRLMFSAAEKPVNRIRGFAFIIIQLAGSLFFVIDTLWVIYVFFSACSQAVFYYLEKKKEKSEIIHLGSLAVSVLITSVFCSSALGLTFNPLIFESARDFSRYFPFLNFVQYFSDRAMNLYAFGLLLVMNEMSMIISLFLQATGINSKEEDPEKLIIFNTRLHAGRIIGFLERTLIFIAIMTNQISAIGFLLAAKGLTRFHELNERKFAEYFLIGSLISAMSAVLIAIWVKLALTCL